MSTKLLKCGFCSNPVPLPENPQVPSVMCPKCYHSIPLQPVSAAIKAPLKGPPPPPGKLAVPQSKLPLPPGAAVKALTGSAPVTPGPPRCRICQRELTGENLSGETCPACTKTVSFAATAPALPARPQPTHSPVPTPGTATVLQPKTAASAGALPPASARFANRFWMANRGRLAITGLAIAILASLAYGVAVVTSPKPRLATPLDFVRTDADFLFHIRVADIWNSALIQEFYSRLPEYARQQSEETVSRVGIGMEFVDSVTITLTNPEQPALCAVVKTNRTYGSEDRKKILPSTASAASIQWETRTHRGLQYDVGTGHVPGTPDTPLAIYSASESLFVMGTDLGVKAALDAYLDARDNSASGKANAESTAMLEWVRTWIINPDYFFVAAGARTANVNQMFAALDDPGASDDVRQRLTATPGVGGVLMNLRSGQAVPPQLKELLAVDSAGIALKLEADEILHIQGRSHFPSDTEAKKSGDLLRGLLSVIQLVPEGAAALPDGHPQAAMFGKLSTFIRGINVESKDRFVSFSATQNLSSLVQDMPGAIKSAMGWQEQELTSAPNLKQLANAMELYHDQYGHYPPAVVMDESGTQPLYSWRVALLPYLGPEAAQLSKEFHLHEPWSSPHNLSLSQKMPAVFEHPLARMRDQRTATVQGIVHGMTPYQFPVGAAAAFFGNRKISKRDIVDGLDQTVMIMETPLMVQWTAPQDVPLAAGKRIEEFLKLPSIAPIETVLFDQTSRQIDRSVSPDIFWGAINPKDDRGLPPKSP